MTGAREQGGSPAGRPSLWRHREYLKLWTAATVSLLGSQVSLLAIPVVAVIILGASPFEFALLTVVERLPFILLTLPAGAWVDRMRRRPILIAGDLGRALVLLTVPAAYAAGVLTIWQLYAVALITGCLTVFFDVASQSYLPSLVDRENLVEANAKLQLSEASAQILGPSLAGVLIGILLAPFAVVVDALSFFASAGFVSFIRRAEPAPARAAVDAEGTRPTFRQEVAEGLRYVLGNRYLRAIAASTGTSNFFSTMVFSIYIYYALNGLGLSVLELGEIGTLGNLGILIAAALAGRIPRWIGVGRTIAFSMLIGGPSGLLIPLANRELAFPMLVTAGFLFGFSAVVYNVNQVSLRQAITPDRLLGRMNATMRFIVWGTIPIGGLLGGVLASTIGIHATLWVGALGGCVAFVPLALSPVRSLSEIPARTESEPGPAFSPLAGNAAADGES